MFSSVPSKLSRESIHEKHEIGKEEPGTMDEKRELRDPDNVYLADETYEVVGAAMEVYYKLGTGFLEHVYHQALSIEFGLRKIPFRSQERFLIDYKGHILDREYVADFF